jgi:hypothetical protein
MFEINSLSEEQARLGAQILLSAPDTIPQALHWTREALHRFPTNLEIIQHHEALQRFPANCEISQQHAQALLLAEMPQESLGYWMQSTTENPNPSNFAAQILCQLLTSPKNSGSSQFETKDKSEDDLKLLSLSGHAIEPAVSREFVKWYRLLVDFHKIALCDRIFSQREIIKIILPTAARVLSITAREKEQR